MCTNVFRLETSTIVASTSFDEHGSIFDPVNTENTVPLDTSLLCLLPGVWREQILSQGRISENGAFVYLRGEVLCFGEPKLETSSAIQTPRVAAISNPLNEQIGTEDEEPDEFIVRSLPNLKEEESPTRSLASSLLESEAWTTIAHQPRDDIRSEWMSSEDDGV
jgi:hypothetical protein